MRKNKILILLIILLYGVNSYCQSDKKKNQTKISEDLFYTKIQDSVYVFTHYFPWGSNGMFILLPDTQGLLINTPCERTGTDSLLNWIEKSFGHLKITAIVTGFHQDNLGGDEVLFSKNIPVYGSDLTVKLVKEKGAELKMVILNSVSSDENKRYFNSYKELNLMPPNKTFPIKEGLELKFGDEVFEVYFPGESHTIDNTVVYLHKRKILYGGCMIKGLEFDNPGFTGYANMIAWPVSVENVMNRFQDCQIVIPGHGKEGGKELLPHMIRVINDWNKKHNIR
ncbi:MAG: MBL fold metallo-hydrolase [Bacteroidota bacterium]|jgi:glyoxylase-like metal-dependent hydrolase (beta-lactamase superfamily II)